MSNTQHDFFLQRNWSDSQWTLSNLAQFQAGIEANAFALALTTNALVAAFGQAPELTDVPLVGQIGQIEAGFRGATAVASGEALGVVTTAFVEEDAVMAGASCFPLCGG